MVLLLSGFKTVLGADIFLVRCTVLKLASKEREKMTGIVTVTVKVTLEVEIKDHESFLQIILTIIIRVRIYFKLHWSI